MPIALVGPAGTYVGPQGGSVGPGGQDEPGLTEAVAGQPVLESLVATAYRTPEGIDHETDELRGNQQEVLEPDRDRG